MGQLARITRQDIQSLPVVDSTWAGLAGRAIAPVVIRASIVKPLMLGAFGAACGWMMLMLVEGEWRWLVGLFLLLTVPIFAQVVRPPLLVVRDSGIATLFGWRKTWAEVPWEAVQDLSMASTGSRGIVFVPVQLNVTLDPSSRFVAEYGIKMMRRVTVGFWSSPKAVLDFVERYRLSMIRT